MKAERASILKLGNHWSIVFYPDDPVTGIAYHAHIYENLTLSSYMRVFRLLLSDNILVVNIDLGDQWDYMYDLYPAWKCESCGYKYAHRDESPTMIDNSQMCEGCLSRLEI